MTSPARLSPRALAELKEAVRWIRRDRPSAANHLRLAVTNLARHLGAHPYSGIARPDVTRPPFRFAVVDGFPYLVVYNPEREPPLIVRVVHGARDLPEVLRDL